MKKFRCPISAGLFALALLLGMLVSKEAEAKIKLSYDKLYSFCVVQYLKELNRKGVTINEKQFDQLKYQCATSSFDIFLQHEIPNLKGKGSHKRMYFRNAKSRNI